MLLPLAELLLDSALGLLSVVVVDGVVEVEVEDEELELEEPLSSFLLPPDFGEP